MQACALIHTAAHIRSAINESDIERIKRAAYDKLYGAEDGEYFFDVDLIWGRTFFATVTLSSWGHVETGAEFMGQREYIGVTDGVRVEFTSAELWYDIDGDGRESDALNVMQGIEKDIESLLL